MPTYITDDYIFQDDVKVKCGSPQNGTYDGDMTIFHKTNSGASCCNFISGLYSGQPNYATKPLFIEFHEISIKGEQHSGLFFEETYTGTGASRTITGSYVKLYNNNSLRLTTTTSGVTISGELKISSIFNAVSDTDKFLVSQADGTVAYRTGAEVLSDIGGGTGTVSSVGLSMPSAFSVASSPVTGSGTIAVTGAGTTSQFVDGTGALQTVTTGTMSSWSLTADSGGSETVSNGESVDIAGGDGITTTRSGATVTVDVDSTIVRTTGAQTVNGTKTFGTVPDVGTRGLADNTTFAASTAWVQGQSYGTVSSVALTETGSALTITGSPVTTSGTLNIAGAGTSSQVILGDLSLATLPVDGVTSIATNAPITGGTITGTGTIGITQASGSSNGYLSSTDWTTFNNKTTNTGTVQSVGLSAQGDAIQITGTPVTTTGTLAISWQGTTDDYVNGEGDLTTFPTIPSAANNSTITINTGTGLSGGGSFTLNQAGNTTLNLASTNNGTVTSLQAANPTTGGSTNNPLFLSVSTTVNPTINFNREAVQDLPNLISTETSTGVGGGVITGTWNANTQLDLTDNTDHSHQGEIVYFGSGTLAQGKIFVLTTPDAEWAPCQASSVGKTAGLLAIALGTSVSDGLLTRGIYTLSYTSTGSTSGAVLYMESASTGQVTHEPPSGTGNFVRILGTQLDATNGIIFFHPDNTFIELS